LCNIKCGKPTVRGDGIKYQFYLNLALQETMEKKAVETSETVEISVKCEG
jgi:hypothetical protein